ncbi:unnamed protein product [Rhodiola kirilowii]
MVACIETPRESFQESYDHEEFLNVVIDDEAPMEGNDRAETVSYDSEKDAEHENDCFMECHEDVVDDQLEGSSECSSHDNNNNLLELKASTKKALLDFRCKIEEAISGHYLYKHTYSNENLNKKEAENLKELELWNVPLSPSKGHEATDLILLKFLKAKDYKVSEAFEMLRKNLSWRRECQVDKILYENFEELEDLAFINSTDREGRPLCYSMFTAFNDRKLYKETFGSETKHEKFLRWRTQCFEKGVRQLSFNTSNVKNIGIVQIIDVNNLPAGGGLKEFRSMCKKASTLLQDYYPELVYRNILINVPLWFYAFHVVLSRHLTPRSYKKYVLARPAKVTETLLKYIAPESLPIRYGGLNRDDDDKEFSPMNRTSQFVIRGGMSRSIKIPIEEGGVTVVWDIATSIGREVTYREEFIPDDEGSYRILLSIGKKMVNGVRNSFYISEPGMLVITVSNPSFKTKRVFYRFKMKPTVPPYILLK